MDDDSIVLAKADESLAGAADKLSSGPFNNCANRSYYACFQAAVSALIQAGYTPSGRDGQWTHAAVQAQVVGDLLNRRKRYPMSLRGTLAHNMELRHVEYYGLDLVSDVQAWRASLRSSDFIAAVRTRRGER